MRNRRTIDSPRRSTGPPSLVAALVVAVLVTAGAAAAQELDVEISPPRAYVSTDGQVHFSVAVYDANGSEVPAEVLWSVIPPRLGRVDGDGLFVAAGAPGKAIIRVRATFEGATGSGHAVVEVGGEPPDRLLVVVRPQSAVVDAGGAAQFSATVTDPRTGDEVAADVTWLVIPERLGWVDGSGLFTSGGVEGAGRVVARAAYNGREGVGDAGVVVGSPPEVRVVVTVVPARALLSPGEEFQFGAVVTDEFGEPVAADVEWSVVPRRLGVIDPSGLFTAGPDESVGRVVATVVTGEGPVRGFGTIEVRTPGPGGVRVRVRPREVALTPGGDVQFEAVVVGPDGEPLDVPVDWMVRPSWLGAIDADGYFTAAETFPEPSENGGWVGTVVASIETTEGTASDAARVLVRDAGPALRLRVRPHSPVVAPGEDVQFEAMVIGAEEPIEWTTEWAVFPEDLGTVTPDGLFTANPAFGDPSSDEFGPHRGIVGARATLPDGSTLTGRARVRVRIPGVPVRVMVRPVFAIVAPGESADFRAIVLGPDGEPVDMPVHWRVVPVRLGTVTDDGTFTAADVEIDPDSWNRPRGLVVAEVTVAGGYTFRGGAVVVIDLPEPQVVVDVSPQSVTLGPGDSFQFHAEARLVDGTPIEMPLEWRVTDDVLGTVTQDGLFTAASIIPPGHSRRTAVLAGGVFEGRLYWDFASVRVMEQK